jgi:hypothetical protein
MLATVQRTCYRSDGMPYMEHRTYDQALKLWGWSDKSIDAWIFEDWDIAEQHIKLLKLQGEKKFVAPFVHSKSEQEKRKFILEAYKKGISPDEAYRQLEKRNLA